MALFNRERSYLGLSKSAGRDSPGRIGHLLDPTLGRDPVLDLRLKSRVASSNILIDEEFENEGRITLKAGGGIRSGIGECLGRALTESRRRHTMRGIGEFGLNIDSNTRKLTSGFL